jgi:hypothetical protein
MRGGDFVDVWGHCGTNRRRAFIKHVSYLMPPSGTFRLPAAS